jgi:hypothetical protein
VRRAEKGAVVSTVERGRREIGREGPREETTRAGRREASIVCRGKECDWGEGWRRVGGWEGGSVRKVRDR